MLLYVKRESREPLVGEEVRISMCLFSEQIAGHTILQLRPLPGVCSIVFFKWLERSLSAAAPNRGFHRKHDELRSSMSDLRGDGGLYV
jgi:hypothetical protein